MRSAAVVLLLLVQHGLPNLDWYSEVNEFNMLDDNCVAHAVKTPSGVTRPRHRG